MIITKLSDVGLMEDGDQVPAVKGTITAIFKRREGESDKGPWSFQNLELKQGSDKCIVTLNNREALAQSNKGKLVMFQCVESSHGKTGVKVKFDDYKKANIIWVTPSAEMDFLQEDGQEESRATAGGRKYEVKEGEDAPTYKPKSVAESSNGAAPKPTEKEHVYGGTVGMAVKGALDVLNERQVDISYFKSVEFSKDLYEIASDIIRVARALEKGNLLPPPKARCAEHSPAEKGPDPLPD